jgi:nicotine blue oxidoreductase
MSLRVAGLVLAAGAGSRFGQPKALVNLDGERLVDRAVRVLAEGGCNPTYVVAGATVLVVPRAIVIDNPEWATGMGSSLRAGLASLAEPLEAVVISLVDQPWIGSEVVRRLIAAGSSGAEVAVAAYDGRRRNPVLLARRWWREAAALAVGDVGARAFIDYRPDLVTPVECADVADPHDIDRPEDLTAAGQPRDPDIADPTRPSSQSPSP